MKFSKYIGLSILFMANLGFLSCHEEDEFVREEKNAIIDMTVQFFNSTDSKTWTGVFSANQDSIYFDLPYYISDIEPIMPDLTQMELRANIPSSAVVTPALAGIKDLSKPYPITVKAGNGDVREYIIQVRLVKSDKKEMMNFSIPSLGLKGINSGSDTIKLIVPPGYDQSLLKNVTPVFSLSSWASVNPDVDVARDFSKDVIYTVTAQDGSAKDITIVQTFPNILDYGFGLTNLMWKKSAAEASFTKGMDCGVAVCGDKLIVARRNLAFTVYDRFTGKLLADKVNMEGTVPNSVSGIIFGIDSDDKDNLLAVNFTRIANADNILKIFRWKNGLENPPSVILELPMTYFATEANRGIDLGRSIVIRGDIDGDAQILILMGGNNKEENRSLRFSVKGGVITNATHPEIVAGEGVSYTWRGKSIPLTTSDNTPFIVASGGTERGIVYMDENRKSYKFVADGGSSFYNYAVLSIGYGEFNHARYMFAASGNWQYQFKILGFDITDPYLIPIDNDDDDYYTKFNVFTSEPNLLQYSSGENANATADVTTKLSEDGNSLYVYMLVTDGGIMAYELTKYENINK